MNFIEIVKNHKLLFALIILVIIGILAYIFYPRVWEKEIHTIFYKYEDEIFVINFNNYNYYLDLNGKLIKINPQSYEIIKNFKPKNIVNLSPMDIQLQNNDGIIKFSDDLSKCKIFHNKKLISSKTIQLTNGLNEIFIICNDKAFLTKINFNSRLDIKYEKFNSGHIEIDKSNNLNCSIKFNDKYLPFNKVLDLNLNNPENELILLCSDGNQQIVKILHLYKIPNVVNVKSCKYLKYVENSAILLNNVRNVSLFDINGKLLDGSYIKFKGEYVLFPKNNVKKYFIGFDCKQKSKLEKYHQDKNANLKYKLYLFHYTPKNCTYLDFGKEKVIKETISFKVLDRNIYDYLSTLCDTIDYSTVKVIDTYDFPYPSVLNFAPSYSCDIKNNTLSCKSNAKIITINGQYYDSNNLKLRLEKNKEYKIRFYFDDGNITKYDFNTFDYNYLVSLNGVYDVNGKLIKDSNLNLNLIYTFRIAPTEIGDYVIFEIPGAKNKNFVVFDDYNNIVPCKLLESSNKEFLVCPFSYYLRYGVINKEIPRPELDINFEVKPKINAVLVTDENYQINKENGKVYLVQNSIRIPLKYIGYIEPGKNVWTWFIYKGVLPYQLVLVCDNKIVPSLQLTNGVVITKRYCQRIEIYKSSVKIYVPMLFEENNYEIFNFIKNIFYRNLKINDSENWTGLIKASYKGYISFDYYPCFDLNYL